MGWTLDMTDQTRETVEREARLEEDWYVGVLDDTHEDAKSGQQVFEFVVKKGLKTKVKYAGERHFERLSAPDLVEEKTEKFHRKKAICWASRLGLLKDDYFGRQVGIEWQDAIGNDYLLKIEHRKYPEKDRVTGQPTGAMAVQVSCGFAVFPLDHEKIPDEVRKGLELPPARKTKDEAAANGPPPGGAAPSGAGTPTIDTSDL
jgi:hypothetical protein